MCINCFLARSYYSKEDDEDSEPEISLPDVVPTRGGKRYHKSNITSRRRRGNDYASKSFQGPFLGRERPGNSRTEHRLKQPVGYKSRLNGRVLKVDERHQARIVKWCLMDIHPNPGPRTVDINRWVEQKLREMRARNRKERRSEKRGSKWTHMLANRSKEGKEHLTGKARKKEKERWRRKVNQKFSKRTNLDSEVITWNLQRCKIQVDGRGRIQHILAAVQENKWDIILLSEISSKEEGVWWYEEDSVLIDGKRAGIIVRNHWAQEWKKQGSQKWLAERVAMVTVNSVKLIAVYQPVSPNDIEIDEYRKQQETAIPCRKKDEMLLIGGDYNAQIGRQDNTGKERTLGKFGLRANSEAGDEVVEWAENNNLYIVDTYFRKNNRGTWCHPRTGNWYELDYFLAKRHRNLIIKDMKVVREDRWSDHRSKMIKVSIREKKERFNRTKQEKIDWRKLRIKKHHDAYQEHISKASLSNKPSWAELAETMKRAAKAACGLEDTRSKTSQWMVGHEDRAR